MHDLKLVTDALPVAEVAAELQREARAESTRRNYRTSAAHFAAWCSAQDRRALPADPATVADYLAAEHAARRAVATIRVRAAAIAEAHRLAGLPDPTSDKRVADTLRGIVRTQRKAPRGRGQAPGLTQDHETVMAHALGSSGRPKDARDLAMLLVGRDLLARASELISLTVEMVRLQPDGTALVDLLRAKTHDESSVCLLSAGTVAALERWLQIAGIKSGPVFIGVTKGGKLTGTALARQDVGRTLKAMGKRVGLPVSFRAHSLRVGMAQDLTLANIESNLILQAAGWRTPRMLARYTEDLNAGNGAIARFRGGSKRR